MGRKAIAPICALALALIAAGCGSGNETTVVSTTPATDESAARPDRPAGAGTPPFSRPVLSGAARRRLESFAASAPGRVGIAVAPLGDGEVVTAGPAQRGRAWSAIKVPLLVALIDRLGGVDRLSAAERVAAEAALTSSDNEAALALFDRLQDLEGGLVPASRAIEDVLRRSGDDETTVNTAPSPQGFSTFGQTIWSAQASARFARALAGSCLLPAPDTEYVVSLMEGVVADQRWGLGSAPVPGGAAVAFKGGWGPQPGGGYLVRQVGFVADGERGYVASIVAIPDDAGADSFAAGQELVTEAATRVADALGGGSRAPITCER